MATLGQTITEVADQFAQASLVYGHGTVDPWDEATALVLGVTGLPDEQHYLETQLDPADLTRISALAGRRIDERTPIPYLVGKTTYAGMEFECVPGVVIPRSPIAQLIAKEFRPWLLDEPAVIVDVCCGSGCLGILSAHAFPRARVVLLDIDATAVALAKRNVQAHGLAGRVEVCRSNLLDGLPAAAQPFDLLICNPPYVDAADYAALPAEYRHEPELGLAAGADGLDVVTQLLPQAADCLTARGLLVCEVGASAPALGRRFPRLAVTWVDLPDGGEGVFVVDRAALDGLEG